MNIEMQEAGAVAAVAADIIPATAVKKILNSVVPDYSLSADAKEAIKQKLSVFLKKLLVKKGKEIAKRTQPYHGHKSYFIKVRTLKSKVKSVMGLEISDEDADSLAKAADHFLSTLFEKGAKKAFADGKRMKIIAKDI